MSSRAKELKRFVEDVLIEEGVTEYEFSVARNAHQQVVFYWKGVRCKYQFPYSPSDYRGMQNSRASLRQAMRAAERHAVPGAPQGGSVLDARGVLPGQPHHVGAGGAGIFKYPPSVRPRWKTGSGQA